MDRLERAIEKALESNPGSTARQLRDQVSRSLATGDVTRKDVNSRLYRGQRDGRFQRSDDVRPRWFVAGSQPPPPSSNIEVELEKIIGRNLNELSAEFGGDPAQSGKLAVRRMGEQIAAAAGMDTEGTTLRVIRVDAGSRPAEDIQLGSLAFTDLVATPFENSALRRTVSRFRFIAFSRASSMIESRLLATLEWAPTPEDLEAMARDYEMAREAVAASNLDRLPAGSQVEFLRYGTKAANRQDVQSLPDGSMATRRAFYLVKRALTPVIGGAVAVAPVEADPEPADGPYATLLFDVLRGSLDDGAS